MPPQCQTEHHLVEKTELAQTYTRETDKLAQGGYAVKISTQQISKLLESWYIPHHIVQQNGKPYSL